MDNWGWFTSMLQNLGLDPVWMRVRNEFMSDIRVCLAQLHKTAFQDFKFEIFRSPKKFI